MIEAAPPQSARLLQQFARYPVPGRVKTRLQEALSAEEACAVHETLLARTAKTLLASQLAPVELWLDQIASHPLITELCHLGAGGPFLQRGEDLGARMAHALGRGLERAETVVLVGSDCPDLDRSYLQEGFSALKTHDLVLGPAEDGGYVLIGCRVLEPRIFEGISWGTGRVLEESLNRVSQTSLSCKLLEPRYDIDRPEDFYRWQASGDTVDQA